MIKKYFSARFGFTLIELLITIAIVGIIAVVAFVALDPARRFADSRDARRWSDTTTILDALKINQVDLVGNYTPVVQALVPSDTNVYMIGTCLAGACLLTCTDQALLPSGAAAVGVNLTALTTGTPSYLAAVPVAPQDPTDVGAQVWTVAQTGFYLRRWVNGSITIGTCQAERAGGLTISVQK